MRSFAKVAEKRRPRVIDLFVADHNPASPMWDIPDPSWAEEAPTEADARAPSKHKFSRRAKSILRKMRRKSSKSRMRSSQVAAEQLGFAHASGVNNTLECMLCWVGPSLRTLSIVLTTTPRFILTPTPLPRLQELTLVAFNLHAPAVDTPDSGFYNPADLPQLTRLHLSSTRADLSLVLHSAPSLTHLRLSGTKDPARLLLGLPDPLPPHLKRIDVQPALGEHRNIGFAQICLVVAHTVHHLRTTFEHMKEVRVVVDGDWAMKRYCYSQALAHRDWFDRLEGGGGCWARGVERAVKEVS